MQKKPLPRLNNAAAQDLIHQLAADTSNVRLGGHSRKRMEKRDFSVIDVYRILREGIVRKPPVQGQEGDWSYLVEYVGYQGRLGAACATIILRDKKLFVKTVEWLDRR